MMSTAVVNSAEWPPMQAACPSAMAICVLPRPTVEIKTTLVLEATKARRNRFWICGRLIFFGQVHSKSSMVLRMGKRACLKSLPATEYVFAYWKQCRAGIDYHVEIDKHYYSVPYTLMRQELWASYTASTVEVFDRGKRVAVHRRGPPNRGHTTLPEHMPSSHRRYADWTPERNLPTLGVFTRFG